MSELKPCPFCGGGGDVMVNGHGGWQAGCYSAECPAQFDYNSPEEAIAAWNRRADGWVSVEELERLRSGVKVLHDFVRLHFDHNMHGSDLENEVAGRLCLMVEQLLDTLPPPEAGQ